MTPAEQFQALDERRIDLSFVCFQSRSSGSDLQWSRVGEDIVIGCGGSWDCARERIRNRSENSGIVVFRGDVRNCLPGYNEWLISTCRTAGFNPRILQDADREPAMISFVAAGLGVALLPEQIKRLPHEGVIFVPLRQKLTADSWAVWKTNNPADCLRQYIRIVKELSQN